MTMTPFVGLFGLGRVPSDHHCVNHGSANRTTSMAKLHHLQPGDDQQNARISKSKIIVTKQNQGRGAGATERVYQQQFYRWHFQLFLSHNLSFSFLQFVHPSNTYNGIFHSKVPCIQGQSGKWADGRGGEEGGEELLEGLLPGPHGQPSSGDLDIADSYNYVFDSIFAFLYALAGCDRYDKF